MKMQVTILLGMVWGGLFMGCQESVSQPDSAGTAQAAEDGVCEVTLAEDAAVLVSEDSAKAISDALLSYFQFQNDNNWEKLLDYYPLHRMTDTNYFRGYPSYREFALDFANKAKDMGVVNRTERAVIRYISPLVNDGDQKVALINLDLLHFVEFSHKYQGDPEGIKGMVEASYGKGNATYYADPGPIQDSTQWKRHWKVEGDNRIWVVIPQSADYAGTIAFLPGNFNEQSGGGLLMSGTAMTEVLRMWREQDPHYPFPK